MGFLIFITLALIAAVAYSCVVMAGDEDRLRELEAADRGEDLEE